MSNNPTAPKCDQCGLPAAVLVIHGTVPNQTTERACAKCHVAAYAQRISGTYKATGIADRTDTKPPA